MKAPIERQNLTIGKRKIFKFNFGQTLVKHQVALKQALII